MTFDCEKVQELLSEFLDEELKEAVCRELQKHLDGCPDCAVHVDSVRKVIRLYREASPQAVPVDIQLRLHDLLKRAREESRGESG